LVVQELLRVEISRRLRPAGPPDTISAMLRIGEVEVLRADDGPFRLDGGAMFGVVPKPLWERECPADGKNRISMTCNCWLLRCGGPSTGSGRGRLVMVDAGMGRDWNEKLSSIYGLDESAPTLLDGLDRLGVRPEEVSTVLLTHLHFDHCGWATRPDGAGGHVPTFPRAEYLVHELEWADAHDPDCRDAASYLGHLYDPLEKAGQLRLLSGRDEIAVAEGLVAIPTGGHTRGHLAWRVDSGGRRALGPGELCPLTPHRRPKWIMGYDCYPIETLEAKRRLLGAAISGGWPVLLNHDPHNPAVRLRAEGRKVLFDPLEV
jgi:glyoxylase-like metal-dependent hydrolase (beta-lactamase superfamily II)